MTRSDRSLWASVSNAAIAAPTRPRHPNSGGNSSAGPPVLARIRARSITRSRYSAVVRGSPSLANSGRTRTARTCSRTSAFSPSRKRRSAIGSRSDWSGTSERFRTRSERPIKRVAQGLLARVVAEVEAQPVHDVGEGHVAIRVGEGERAPGARVAEGALAGAEAEVAQRAREAQREGRVDLQHLVEPAVRRRRGKAGQLLDRGRRQAKREPGAAERGVGAGDGPRRP